jgi:hypothetical protein
VSAVVYTRVPEALKQAVQARARERGLSLNAAVCELVERGLQARADKRASEGRERALAACASELEQERARLAEAELRLEAAREREQGRARIERALAERARHELASCPQCRERVRGTDLLVSGHCPKCGRALTAMLGPRPQLGAPDPDEYLAFSAHSAPSSAWRWPAPARTRTKQPATTPRSARERDGDHGHAARPPRASRQFARRPRVSRTAGTTTRSCWAAVPTIEDVVSVELVARVRAEQRMGWEGRRRTRAELLHHD